MSSLYELKEEYLKLFDMIDSGEYSEDTLKDTLEAIGAEFEEKADNIACFIKTLNADSDAIKAEADSLTERARAKKAKADRLKQYLFENLVAAG